MEFTKKQEQVLNARGHNILVSAAAGSGKTAVLVERIVRMISEGDHPIDIDRLLVVTFTRAAAAQMRERIGEAISKKLEERPWDRHLQKQETLLHHAQIVTIDSFCTFLLRNYFSEIDLDPGFRQMDETQARLLETRVLQDFIEEQYEAAEQEKTTQEKKGILSYDQFYSCVNWFCTGRNDKALEERILSLHREAQSHPYPEAWLLLRRNDYDIKDEQALFNSSWYRSLLLEKWEIWKEQRKKYDMILRIANEADGPYPYLSLLEQEEESLFYGLDQASIPEDRNKAGMQDSSWDPEQVRALLVDVSHYEFRRLPAIRGKDKEYIDPQKKEMVSDIRSDIKGAISSLAEGLDDPAAELWHMRETSKNLQSLIDLTIGYESALEEEKRKKNVIDFSDLEHNALNILIEREQDGTLQLRKTAKTLREAYEEVLIDEYQDSNEVQELLLCAVTGEKGAGFSMKEEENRYARFMVGDVKQSIYRFRNARPELFEEKMNFYVRKNESRSGSNLPIQTERIDLDQNFRSRAEVLDAVNGVFSKIMRREIGGVEYGEDVSLKQGAVYPEPEITKQGEDPYACELLLVECKDEEEDKNGQAEKGNEKGQTKEGNTTGKGEDGHAIDSEDDLSTLSDRKKEALAVAQKIHELVGNLPVTDPETKEQRPACYKDIVILLRAQSGREEAFREIFEKEGIPLYLEYKGGYFEAQEVRTILQMLRVLDNPRQDIPMYGAMHGFFGGFTLEEISLVRSASPNQEDLLYDALVLAGQGELPDIPSSLQDKCCHFLSFLEEYREWGRILPVHELISRLIQRTGYEEYVRALPSGQKREANLHSLLVKADAFEESGEAGLYPFLLYIDEMLDNEVDYAEANALNEQANVVRLSTIHKSKGLEYPICFVCGLGSRLSFRKDTNGPLILDPDLGVGTDYVDVNRRFQVPTLRKMAVAKKIKEDSLGEELRILYVGMTRAQEKLILTGAVNDIEKTKNNIQKRMACVDVKQPHLPISVIQSASNFLTLILCSMEAWKTEGKEPISCKEISVSHLKLEEAGDQASLGELKKMLLLAEEQGRTGGKELPNPKMAKELSKQFSWRYPYENLVGLYTKTTVSELKHAAWIKGELPEEEDRGMEWYPEEQSLPRPRFAVEESLEQKETEEKETEEIVETGKTEERRLTGTEYGTAVHRIMECWDFNCFSDSSSLTKENIEEELDRLWQMGKIPQEYLLDVRPQIFLPFLRSPLAHRMAKAQSQGRLKREQPFTLGVSADHLDPSFPPEETVLIQGVIDAYFIEGEGNNKHVVLLDYKTDHVKTAEELALRYRIQLQYYAKALEEMLMIPVSEKILYSFSLDQEVQV